MIVYTSDDCAGCGQCLDICAGSAFTVNNVQEIEFNDQKCLLCDECEVVQACPADAVKDI